MIGYKVFSEGFTCTHGDMDNIKMEVGKTYTLDGEPKIANHGYHFCTNLLDCFNYYSIDMRNRITKIDAIGDIVGNGDKYCTNKITILKEIQWEDVEKEIIENGLLSTKQL